MQKIAPYGCWSSPITAAHVATGATRYSGLLSANGAFYWVEGRPDQGGRNVIVRAKPGKAPRDLLYAPYNARSKVHEYGGGAFFVNEGDVYFINGDDQEYYCLGSDGEIERITNAPDLRFADGIFDQAHNRLIAVAEWRQGGDPHAHPQNLLVGISLNPQKANPIEVLASGRDFYAYPRLSPDGKKLAWIEWDLPHMPWETSQLWVGGFSARGRLIGKQVIAGGNDYAASEPQWDATGKLYFISDQSGWGTICFYDGDQITALPWAEHEFGHPLWGLATSTYVVSKKGGILALCYKGGVLQLATYNNGKWSDLNTSAAQIEAVAGSRGRFAVIAATQSRPPSVFLLDEDIEPLRRVFAAGNDDNISHGEMIAFTIADGQSAHGVYYPPRNGRFAAPEGERPPVIISAHGGPTGMADRGLKMKIQFWTSRGFGFFDIDYRGSAGYGRAWRDALNGNWGVSDVLDMQSGARHLVAEGLADPERLLISGSSAGGFTVLATLCSSSMFAAGASYYGVGDLEKLQACTHKFESGYLHTLLGADKALLNSRSPIHKADQIQSPVIFFQGSKDPVVPPSQSRDMANALKANGIATCYIEFAGESHGFRWAKTIIKALNSEYSFYASILGLKTHDNLPKITLE